MTQLSLFYIAQYHKLQISPIRFYNLYTYSQSEAVMIALCSPSIAAQAWLHSGPSPDAHMTPVLQSYPTGTAFPDQILPLLRRLRKGHPCRYLLQTTETHFNLVPAGEASKDCSRHEREATASHPPACPPRCEMLRCASLGWHFYPKHSDTARGNNSGLSVLLKDTSTRTGIEPPTPWLEDRPANYWHSDPQNGFYCYCF